MLKNELNRTKNNINIRSDINFTKSIIGQKLKSISLSNPNPTLLFKKSHELINEEEWKELIISMDHYYNNFAERLKKKYPKISKEDIHLCCLLKLKRDIPDIALFLGINSRSVIKKKSRLKLKKLELQNNVDFDEFLDNF